MHAMVIAFLGAVALAASVGTGGAGKMPPMLEDSELAAQGVPGVPVDY